MENRHTPVIAQAPMDGVSDAAFRYITDVHGRPDMLFTEFVPVEGIVHGRAEVLRPFIRHETKTPTIAQIYGTELPAFHTATIIALELGFDGIDINMGCPDKSVSGRGAGAGLIRTPDVARDIVVLVKKGVRDWKNGMNIADLDLRTRMKDASTVLQNRLQPVLKRERHITVSVKTRLGCECSVASEWIPRLAEMQIDWITLHGRTLKQLYTGRADWEEIARAKRSIAGTGVRLFGNGDIQSRQEALDKIQTYQLDGAMIGRASWGNPWVFCDEKPDTNTRLLTALEHCEAYTRLIPDGYFPPLRKHLAWYSRGFEQSSHVRRSLMQVSTLEDVRAILSPFISDIMR